MNDDDEDVKDGLKKSMSEPAKRKFWDKMDTEGQKRNENAPGINPFRNRSRESDSEWESKFDRNRG